MRNLIYILLFLPLALSGQTVINLSPDSTLHDLHALTEHGEAASSPTASTYDSTNFYLAADGSDDVDAYDDTIVNIAALNALTLDPGDSVFFERGGVWRETLTVPNSGTSGNRIVFTSYGTGNKPLILGSEKATTWTSYQGDTIWASADSLYDPFADNDAEIFFMRNDSVFWGKYDTVPANLTQEYEWCVQPGSDSTILVYSLTDPDTRYDSIEVPQRDYGIDLNDKQYLTFSNIELMFQDGYGIYETYPQGSGFTDITIDSVDIAYNGEKDGGGYGIGICFSNTIIRNCVIHDCGRRGVSFYNYSTGNITNVVIENNTFYNGYHTTGIDCNAGSIGGASGNIDSVIVRNNFMYETQDRTFAEGSSDMNFISGDGAGTGEVRDFYFYNNILKYASQDALQLEDVDSAYVYNNTFFSHNNVITASTNHLLITDGSTNIKIKNNLFYGGISFETNGAGNLILESASQDVAEIDADYNLYYRTADNLRIIIAGATNYYRTAASFSAMKTATGWDDNSPVPTAPQFVDASGDYDSLWVYESSPAAGAGTTPLSLTDYSGQTWTAPYNIGAYNNTESVTYPDSALSFEVSSTRKDTVTIAILGFDASVADTFDILEGSNVVYSFAPADTGAYKDTIHIPSITSDTTLTYKLRTGNVTGIYTAYVYNTDTVAIDTAGVAPLSTGLFAYYSSEESSGNLIDSVGTAHGTATGTIDYSQTGVSGNAMGPNDASSRFTITGIDTADVKSAFTFHAWVKNSTDWRAIGGFEGQASRGWRVDHDGTDHARFTVYSASGATTLASSDTYTAGTFYHFVCTYDGTTMKMYINGSLQSSTPSSGVPLFNSAVEFWLYDLSGASSALNGDLDEIGFWSRALPLIDIQWLYNSGSGKSYTDIVNK